MTSESPMYLKDFFGELPNQRPQWNDVAQMIDQDGKFLGYALMKNVRDGKMKLTFTVTPAQIDIAFTYEFTSGGDQHEVNIPTLLQNDKTRLPSTIHLQFTHNNKSFPISHTVIEGNIKEYLETVTNLLPQIEQSLPGLKKTTLSASQRNPRG